MRDTATGAEIRACWDDMPQSDGYSNWYIDDDTVVETFSDVGFVLDFDKVYQLADLGTLCWQGPGSPPKGAPAFGGRYVEFLEWFGHWHQQRTIRVVVVTLPPHEVAELQAICVEHGWTITT